jgi:carboxymethylenebutenolidase
MFGDALRATRFFTVFLLQGLMSFAAGGVPASKSEVPETVVVASGALRLTALLWRPSGPGPFPAVIFNHGSGPTDPSRAQVLGPVFARHGYVFLFLFRRGDGLSASQGLFMGDLLDRERAVKGEEARNRLQLLLLTTDQLDDVSAGIAFWKRSPGVDPGRIAVAGHSFGGSLTILAAERDSTLRAAVGFAPAAVSWDKSAGLRERLLAAVRRGRVPIFLVYAANDFSTAPGEAIGAELKRSGKPGEVKIYPAVGRTPAEGHGAVYTAIPQWEGDVFGFLDRYVRR